MQSSTAMQQSCTFSQGNCFFPGGEGEKEEEVEQNKDEEEEEEEMTAKMQSSDL